ncbi:MAG: HlyD family efflux transporter periplasmic adaptor subunit [Planctomycetaceae bacterium]|nr:HlyD family efflux transporter periplasmic adaptor subunit [Planctomycetaceae bacterium]
MRAEPMGLPFRMRPDLQVTPVEWAGELLYVVKDPVALRYFHLPPLQYRALSELNGGGSLGEWADRVETSAAASLSFPQLRAWLQEFLRWGLVTRERWSNNVPTKSQHWQTMRALWAVASNPLYIQFPGFDPSRPLRLLESCCGALCSAAGVGLTLLFAAVVWLQTLVSFEEFMNRLPGWEVLQDPVTWLSIWGALGATKVVHELAHGLVARRLGAECHTIGFSLVMFSPCLYCDVSDAWRLPSRRARIAIAFAGIWAETVMGALALAAWWATGPGLFHEWCWHVAAVSTLATLLVNLNPLVRYDGYYILSDLTGVPNLRQQAENHLDQLLRRIVHGRTGVSPLPGYSCAMQLGLASYTLAAGLYRVTIVVSMSWGLYAFLAPAGLESLVWLYAASASAALGLGGVNRMRRVAAGAEGGRPRFVGLLILAGLALVSWGLLQVPVRWPERAPFVVDVVAPQPIFVSTPGELTAVHVRPGDHVEEGQVLAELSNPELERRRLDLLVRCAQREQDIELARVQDQQGVREEAEAALRTLAQQLAELERQRARLRICAPGSGSVIPPDWKAPPADDAEAERLPSWSGYPLAADQRGAWLEAGTLLLSISPNADRRALVELEQHQRPDLAVGVRVELQPDGRPRERFPGVITDIASRTIHERPPELGQYPTPLAQGTQAKGATANVSVTVGVFPAVVTVDAADFNLPIGSTGWVRLTTRPRTLWERGCDELRRVVPVLW